MRAIALLIVVLALAGCGGSITGPETVEFEARVGDETSRPLVPGD